MIDTYARIVRSLLPAIYDLRAQKTAPMRTDTFARVINHSPRFAHYFVANRHATKRKAQINPSLNYQRHWTKMADKDAASEGEHFRAGEH
jgi:hypothetical protein